MRTTIADLYADLAPDMFKLYIATIGRTSIAQRKGVSMKLTKDSIR
jgi:hypothetical protein